jgi:integrase family protein with SAM-like domain
MASLEGAEQRWQRPAKDGEPVPSAGRLKKFFSGIRALAVTTDMLNRYVASCREQGLSNATINRDLAALRRAFNLALSAGKLQKVPCFPHLKESAPRSGFVEEAAYTKRARMPASFGYVRCSLQRIRLVFVKANCWNFAFDRLIC